MQIEFACLTTTAFPFPHAVLIDECSCSVWDPRHNIYFNSVLPCSCYHIWQNQDIKQMFTYSKWQLCPYVESFPIYIYIYCTGWKFSPIFQSPRATVLLLFLLSSSFCEFPHSEPFPTLSMDEVTRLSEDGLSLPSLDRGEGRVNEDFHESSEIELRVWE